MAFLNQPIISPLLIGRVQERQNLRQILDEARQGKGAVMLLAGEAGVGKSRLAADARQQAIADGFEVRVGQCFEHDADFAYAPLIDALRGWLAPLPPAQVATLLGAHVAEVVKLLPELVHSIAAIQPTAPLDGEAEKRRTFESLFQVLVQSALPPRSTPILVIVEDLHWSDESSLAFLHLLARRTAALPLVVIGTFRNEEAQPQLRRWLAHLARERLAHEFVLRPLTLDEVIAMVQAIFTLEHPPRTETIALLFNLTEGNPFFVEEVLKVLVAGGSIFLRDNQWTRKSLDEIQLPATIHDAVNRRTAWLSAAARRVLTLAAVAGRRFDFALLQHITGYHDQELLALIKELVDAQLVVEVSADYFTFRHALTQKVVYDGLLTRERQPLHRAVGTALEVLHVATPGSRVAQLAYHYYAAGEWGKALVYAHQAGAQAQALYEPRAAAEQRTRALTAADHLPQPQAWLPMLRGRAWAYEMLGQIDEARGDYERALTLARNQGDRQEEWRTLLDLGALWSAQDYAQAGDCYQQALDLARRGDDDLMLADSLNYVGNWHVNLNRPQAALHCHQEALQIFHKANDLRGQARTLDFMAMAKFNDGDLLGSVRYYQQALTLSRALNDRAAMSSIWATLTIFGGCYITETLVGQPTHLSEEAFTSELARHLAQEIGWRANEAYALITLAQVHANRGDYGRALTYAHEGLAIAEAIDHHEWMASAHCGLGCFYLDLFAPHTAHLHLTTAMELAQQTGSVIWRLLTNALTAIAHIQLGNGDAAEAMLSSMMGIQTTTDHTTTDHRVHTISERNCLLAHAHLALAKGAPARAQHIVDELIATTRNIDLAGMQPAPILLLVRSEALMALGQESVAEQVLLMAQAGAQAQLASPLLWRILATTARLYQRQMRPREAAETAASARSLIEQIAHTIPEPTLRESFIARAIQHLPTVTTPNQGEGVPRPGGLTPREAEVAELIAQGYSNRKIATQLVITERTVTTHISHIFGKLDFHTRTQIAAWVASQSQ